MTYPSWVPQALLEAIDEESQGIDDQKSEFPSFQRIGIDSTQFIDFTRLNALTALAKNESVREVWESLERNGVRPNLFVALVNLGLIWPPSAEHTKPEKERQAWLDEIVALSSRLAELVAHTKYDRILEDSYYARRNKEALRTALVHTRKLWAPEATKESIGPRPYESWPDLSPGRMSTHLKEMATLAEDQKNTDIGGLERLPRPNAKNAARNYFIKVLSLQLKKSTGMYLRKAVAITASVIFDDDSIDERTVRKIAPGQ